MSTAAPIKKIPLTSSNVVIAQMQQAIFENPMNLCNQCLIAICNSIAEPNYSKMGKLYNVRNVAQDITKYFAYLNGIKLLEYKADTTLTQTIVKPWVVINNLGLHNKTVIDCKSLTALFAFIFRTICDEYAIANNGYSIDLYYYDSKTHVGIVPLHVSCSVYSRSGDNEQSYNCDMAKLLLLLQNGHLALAQPVKVVKYCNHSMTDIPFAKMAKVTVKNPL